MASRSSPPCMLASVSGSAPGSGLATGTGMNGVRLDIGLRLCRARRVAADDLEISCAAHCSRRPAAATCWVACRDRRSAIRCRACRSPMTSCWPNRHPCRANRRPASRCRGSSIRSSSGRARNRRARPSSTSGRNSRRRCARSSCGIRRRRREIRHAGLVEHAAHIALLAGIVGLVERVDSAGCAAEKLVEQIAVAVVFAVWLPAAARAGAARARRATAIGIERGQDAAAVAPRRRRRQVGRAWPADASRLAFMRSMVALSAAHWLTLRENSEKPQLASLARSRAFDMLFALPVDGGVIFPRPCRTCRRRREAAASSASSCRQTREAACGSVTATAGQASAPSSAARCVSFHRPPVIARNPACLPVAMLPDSRLTVPSIYNQRWS